MTRKALGRGLSSLIPGSPDRPSIPVQSPATSDGYRTIDIDRIRPNREQPRKSFDNERLAELAASLKKDGVLQPIVVRPAGDGFELIAGERRWRAAQLAGLLRVPAVVRRDVADERMLELALIENLQRQELNPIDEARAFQTLIDDLGLTQQEVAERVGRQRATVANSLRLLALPVEIQERLRRGELNAGHAKALAGLSSPKQQIDLAARCVAEGLSVRQVEAVAARLTAGSRPGTGRTAKSIDPNVAAAQDALQQALATKVRVHQGKAGGRIELHFFSHEEMERIYDLLLAVARRRAD